MKKTTLLSNKIWLKSFIAPTILGTFGARRLKKILYGVFSHLVFTANTYWMHNYSKMQLLCQKENTEFFTYTVPMKWKISFVEHGQFSFICLNYIFIFCKKLHWAISHTAKLQRTLFRRIIILAWHSQSFIDKLLQSSLLWMFDLVDAYNSSRSNTTHTPASCFALQLYSSL